MLKKEELFWDVGYASHTRDMCGHLSVTVLLEEGQSPKTHCAAEECHGGQGPSAWACLTSIARSGGADGPSPRNPTTTGSNRDSSGSSASVKARNSLQGRAPIKSLCSPVSTSQVLINAPVSRETKHHVAPRALC